MATLDVRFRPLPTWPGRSTRSRRKLGGETTYTAVLDRLETELGHLKAADVVIETGHRADDIRMDGWIRSNARVPSHPGVILWFTAKATRGGKPVGAQRHSMDSYTTWQDNLRALVLRLEALRAVDRYGGEVGGEQYTGYTPLPPPPPPKEEPKPGPAPSSPNGMRQFAMPTNKTAAAKLLLYAAGEAVMQSSCQKLVNDVAERKRIYRLAAQATHPDTGGTHNNAVAVQTAYDLLGRDK